MFAFGTCPKDSEAKKSQKRSRFSWERYNYSQSKIVWNFFKGILVLLKCHKSWANSKNYSYDCTREMYICFHYMVHWALRCDFLLCSSAKQQLSFDPIKQIIFKIQHPKKKSRYWKYTKIQVFFYFVINTCEKQPLMNNGSFTYSQSGNQLDTYVQFCKKKQNWRFCKFFRLLLNSKEKWWWLALWW